MAVAAKITIEWADGDVGVFERQPDDSWHQSIAGVRVTGYDAPNVMRVLATATGTREVAK
jgi:hypothetical protein